MPTLDKDKIRILLDNLDEMIVLLTKDAAHREEPWPLLDVQLELLRGLNSSHYCLTKVLSTIEINQTSN